MDGDIKKELTQGRHQGKLIAIVCKTEEEENGGKNKMQTHTQKEDVQLILRARMGTRKMRRERRNT